MGLWMDEEEAAEVAELRAGTRTRDARICSCGHPATRHAVVEVPGRGPLTRCKPGRSMCACGGLAPVLEARDTRTFLAKTDGPGPRHALMTGVEKLAAKYPDEDPSGLVTWLVDLRCPVEGCQVTGLGVRPFPLDAKGRVSWKAEKVTGFACREHLSQLPVAPRPGDHG